MGGGGGGYQQTPGRGGYQQTPGRGGGGGGGGHQQTPRRGEGDQQVSVGGGGRGQQPVRGGSYGDCGDSDGRGYNAPLQQPVAPVPQNRPLSVAAAPFPTAKATRAFDKLIQGAVSGSGVASSISVPQAACSAPITDTRLTAVPPVDIHHYDVKITPEVLSNTVTREILLALKIRYLSHLGLKIFAYDGSESLYTAGPLPFESQDFDVVLGDSKGSKRERKFLVKITFAAQTGRHQLQEFLNRKQRDAFSVDGSEDKSVGKQNLFPTHTGYLGDEDEDTYDGLSSQTSIFFLRGSGWNGFACESRCTTKSDDPKDLEPVVTTNYNKKTFVVPNSGIVMVASGSNLIYKGIIDMFEEETRLTSVCVYNVSAEIIRLIRQFISKRIEERRHNKEKLEAFEKWRIRVLISDSHTCRLVYSNPPHRMMDYVDRLIKDMVYTMGTGGSHASQYYHNLDDPKPNMDDEKGWMKLMKDVIHHALINDKFSGGHIRVGMIKRESYSERTSTQKDLSYPDDKKSLPYETDSDLEIYLETGFDTIMLKETKRGSGHSRGKKRRKVGRPRDMKRQKC